MDCLIPTTLSIPRSVILQILGVCLPFVALLGGWAYWIRITRSRKFGWKLLFRRFLLTTIVVSYVSYIALSKTAIRIFKCVDVFDESLAYSRTTHKYWESDSFVRCFHGSHLILCLTLGIALLLFSLCFPLYLAIFLTKARTGGKLNSSEVQETVGLFYHGYEENFVFWDSIIMLRKATLVDILVFAYSLGGNLQGLLATALLFFSLFLQTKFDPFKRDFRHLNELECASLFVSGYTFLSGLVLNDPNLNSNVLEILITATIFITNMSLAIILFVFLVFVYVDQLKFELLAEGIGTESMGRVFVIRAYLAFQARKALKMAKSIITNGQNATSPKLPAESDMAIEVTPSP